MKDTIQVRILTCPEKEKGQIYYSKELFKTSKKIDEKEKKISFEDMELMKRDKLISRFKKNVHQLKYTNPEQFQKSVIKINSFKDNYEKEFDKLDIKKKLEYFSFTYH